MFVSIYTYISFPFFPLQSVLNFSAQFHFAASLEQKTISCPPTSHGHEMKMTLIGCCRRYELKGDMRLWRGRRVSHNAAGRWEEGEIRKHTSSQWKVSCSVQCKHKVMQIQAQMTCCSRFCTVTLLHHSVASFEQVEVMPGSQCWSQQQFRDTLKLQWMKLMCYWCRGNAANIINYTVHFSSDVGDLIINRTLRFFLLVVFQVYHINKYTYSIFELL